MFWAAHRGACAPRRLLNAVQLWVEVGDQASSAIAGNRGNAMYSMSPTVTMVSVHSGASGPRTDDALTFLMNVPGSQPYASFTSIRPAQSWPSLVFDVYFMSRYALFAGDITSFVPWAAAAATSGAVRVVSQYCATVDGSGVAPTTW